MSRKSKSTAYCRGQEIWSLLSESDRTAVRVLAELRGEGYRASRATVSRWVQEWRRVVHTATEMLAVEAGAGPRAETREIAIRSDLPAELKEILPARLMPVARETGIAAIEDAICAVSDAIRSEARNIVSDQDKTRLRTFVSALGAMASAMEQVANVRTATSTAHRSYCEGDRLLAEAEKLRAEARKTDAEAQAVLPKPIEAREIQGSPNDDYDPIADAFEKAMGRR